MLVSRKNLAFIHFVSIEVTAGLDVPQPLHQGIDFLCIARLGGKLQQPFAKGGIESLALGSSDEARLLNEVVVCAERYVFHTDTVYTNFVLAHKSSRTKLDPAIYASYGRR